jgi:hypothetical protein
MGIGMSVFLIAAGAILLFGLNISSPDWVDLDAVGWILMAAGVVGLLVTVSLWRRSRTVVREKPVIDERLNPPRYG